MTGDYEERLERIRAAVGKRNPVRSKRSILFPKVFSERLAAIQIAMILPGFPIAWFCSDPGIEFFSGLYLLCMAAWLWRNLFAGWHKEIMADIRMKRKLRTPPA